MRLYARNQYDRTDVINYNPFSTSPFEAANPDNSLYKRLILRFATSGGSQIVDIVTQKIMEAVYPGLQRTRHAVQYINGEFCRLTNM